MVEVRNGIHTKERTEKNLLICNILRGMSEIRAAESVLFYYPVGGEVDLIPFMNELAKSEKKVFLPKLVDDETFVPLPYYDYEALVKNEFGIPEPAEQPEAPLQIPLGVILVPGLAFDRMGTRLGMGKGYYDRFLKQYPESISIGVAFQEQVLDQLPKDPYDSPVDMLVTDSDMTRFL